MAAVVSVQQTPERLHRRGQAWFLQEGFSQGTNVSPSAHSTHIYTPGGKIVRVWGTTLANIADTNFRAVVCAAHTRRSPRPGPAHDQAWTTSQVHWDVRAGDGAWDSGQPVAENLFLAWQRVTSDFIAAGDVTLWWANLVVIHRRYGWDGSQVDAATSPSLTTEQLVKDLLGRGLGTVFEFDPTRTAPGTPWDTLIVAASLVERGVRPGGAGLRAAKSPRMWWAAFEPGATGRPALDFGRWDGPVRYVFAAESVKLEMSGGAADVANRCLVRYVGTTFGQSKTTWVAEVRAHVPLLDDAGLTRTMTLDITSEGLLPTQDARARGIAALRLASLAKTAGRVTIREPVYDRVQGRMVNPWEVRAGSPVVVCDAPLDYSRSTSLTDSTAEDGVAVFRATTMAYDTGRNEATLTLDGGSRSLIGRLKTEAHPRRYEVGTART
jgi:hypothetical protein